MTIRVRQTLSPDDIEQISQIATAMHAGPLLQIEEESVASGRHQLTPGADMVVSILVWGGYDRCLDVGVNPGCTLERVRGRWRRIRNSDWAEYA
jgi:hypothetical protein